MAAIPSRKSWRDPARVSAPRALVMMAFGALAGLLLAGYALFTAKGTSTLMVPADDVALVNQQPISRIDFIAELRSLYDVDPTHATPEQRAKVLEDMILQELFVQRGNELDMASVDPQVRSALVNAVEESTAADALTTVPGDEKLRAYYNAHRDDFATQGLMTVRDLLFPPEAKATQAAAAIASGTAVDEAVKSAGGADTGNVKGEEFYFAARIHLGEALFDRARRLADGAVSPAVAQPDGVHLLVMVKNTPPKALDFVAARASVLDRYQRDAVKILQAGNAAFLRKRANILVAEDMR